jgi:hypothetical protein
MPKLKTKKTLTRTLYCYTRPVNNQWVRQNYKKLGYASYSEFIDGIIDHLRTKKAVYLSYKKHRLSPKIAESGHRTAA